MIISQNIDFNSVYWFEKINARNAESIAIGIDLMKVPPRTMNLSGSIIIFTRIRILPFPFQKRQFAGKRFWEIDSSICEKKLETDYRCPKELKLIYISNKFSIL